MGSKIEIDLAELGVTYDLDGEEAGNNTLQTLIVEAAARKLVNAAEQGEVRDMFRELARERIRAKVDEVLDGPITETSRWGEPKRTTTVTELIQESLETYLSAPARGNRDFGSREAQNLRELIQDAVGTVMTRDLRKQVERAKAEVHKSVTDSALAAAVAILNKG